LGVGFAVWLVATVAFRLVGQFVLDPANPLVIGALYVAVVPAMVGLALLVYRWQSVSGPIQVVAAIALVLPGMLLDAFVMAWFELIFPNMVPGAAKYFGGMLLLAYGVVLLTGFTPRE
jgi:uncharacterized membrane protein YjjP (DUF1212 family)